MLWRCIMYVNTCNKQLHCIMRDFFKYTLPEKYYYDTEIWVFLQLTPKASPIAIWDAIKY